MPGSDSTQDDTPPQSPLFANAPGASPVQPGPRPGTPAEQQYIDQIEQLFKSGRLGERYGMDKRGRAQQFLPYLLIRAFTGDNGNRPFNAPFWESPDIWTAPGDPSVSPDIPASHGGTLTAGVPNTVYAHVWNLGRAPIAGARVEFYWFNPSLAIDGANANLIGMTRVDLAPRSSSACHKLVKCPVAWVPVMENGGHECLIVRLWGFGDDIGPNNWQPWENRHIGQLNVSVVANMQQMLFIVSRFALTAITAQTRFEVAQIGPEGKDAAHIVAPGLAVDPKIATHALARLDNVKTLTVVPTPATAPRIMPHLLTGGGAAPIPAAVRSFVAPEPGAAGTITATRLAVRDATLTTLVGHSALFDDTMLRGITAAPAPAAGEAHIVRISQYDGAQVVGGYTMVIGGG
jgi:hypothetical protein